ncbi:MAG: OmpA family protein [Endomicrobia bacterium]|nr:OmpA family protein [Endomicrobiia bacterium]
MKKFISSCFFLLFLCASAVYAQSANHDLFLINESTGTREFVVSGVYNIDSSLSPTGSGNFTVKGNSIVPSDNILSGILVSTNGVFLGSGGSLFNIAQAGTTFTLLDITVSSANIIGSGSVLVLNNAASSALITNAILDKNNATQNGGAIYALSGTLEIINTVMQNNGATSSGGAIYNQTTAVLEYSSFASNTAANGGAIFNSGANGKIYVLGDVAFNNNSASVSGGAIYNNTSGVIISTAIGAVVSFSSNNAITGSGGAIYNVSQVTISSSQFLNNTANTSAGAIYNTGTVNLTDSLFESNRAVNGGAVYNTGAAFNISGNVSFSSNSANTNGGAFYNAGNFTVLSTGFVSFDSNNVAFSGSGGALYNTGTATLYAAEFINNTATLNGGAVYSAGTLNLGNVTMDSNISFGSGGAIYNQGANAKINITGNTVIENNTSALDGAGIYNNGGAINAAVGSTLSFDSNESLNGSGGAVYNSSGVFTSALGSYVEFLSNTASQYGGAIYNGGVVPSNLSGSYGVQLLGGSLFSGNAAFAGGAVYNASTDENSGVYIGGNSQFVNNFALTQGGAIYNAGTFYLDSTSGNIIFDGNMSAGHPNDIYNALTGALYITGGANDVVINGGILGASNAGEDYGIFKTGSGRLLVNGDSSGYTGNFFLEEGTVIFSTGFFTGNSSITGGVLDIAQGGNITTGIIRVYGAGTMNIDTTDDLVFSGSLLGDPDFFSGGTVNKNSTGTLTFVNAHLNRPINIYAGVLEASTGTVFSLGESVRLFNNSTFTVTTPGSLTLYNSGLVGGATTYASNVGGGTLNIIGNNSGFQGTYEQYGGKTIVTSARGQYGSMFTGINNIYDSVLDVTQTYFTRNNVTIGYDVNLFNNAEYSYRNRTVAPTIINTSHVTFNGNNSSAYFGKARELVRNAQYILMGDFADNGTGNTITFEDSIVNLPAANYNNDYTFINSIFDLTALTVSPTPGASTHSVTFTDLTLSGNNGVTVGIDFVDMGSGIFQAGADKLYTTGLSSSVYLYDVKLYSGADNYVTAGTYYAQVLFGGLTFDDTNIKSFTAIRAYNTFDLTIDPTRLTEVMIGVTSGIDYHSLYTRNAELGNRGFSVQEAMTYYIDMPLSDTAVGIFMVMGGEGNDVDASQYIISGNINGLGAGNGSFFNLVDLTTFEMWNLTMADAYINSDGSVLRMSSNTASAVFSNVILSSNASDNRGGAIWANTGELYIDSMTAYNNYASSGGVMYVSDGVSVKFDNSSRFINNTAYAGGVIYAENLASRIFIENTNVLFSSNTASSNGGAIYAYNSPIDFVDSTVVFSSNTAEGSGGGAIYADTSNINFTGGNVSFSGNVAENGGAIYGSGVASHLTFYQSNTNFINNSAENGGAIAIINSTMSMTLTMSDVLFEGNSAASGKGADIYMENSELDIILTGFTSTWHDSLTLKGGIYVETENNVINKTGSGVFTLMGDNYIQGLFDVSGGRFNVTDAEYVHDNGTFTLHDSRGMYVSGSTMTFYDTTNVIMTNNYYDEYIGKFDGTSGGALTLSSGSVMLFAGNVEFSSNSVYENGAAIYNDGGSLVTFSGASGQFLNNTAVLGGTIYNTGASTVAFYNANITFSSNSAVSGGAIYNDAASFLSIMGNMDFSGNTASGNGGAIANAGFADVIADNSYVTFSGNTAADSGGLGGAIYNTAILNLTTLNDGEIAFSGNVASGTPNDIYNAAGAKININGDSGSVTVNSGIRGVAGSTITKSGNNIFNIRGNSSGYTGRFEQTGGTTVVTSNYFTGISSITAGVLELATGTVLGGGTIGIYGAGDMEITTPGNLTFSGQVTGNGTINKPSTGTLTLTGNNSNFIGVYTQTAGTTTVTSAGRMFAGTNNIISSVLNVTRNAATMGYNVNLGDNGLSNYYSAYTGITNISAQNVTFIGNNAKAYFGSNTTASRSFNLAGAFGNSGTGNEVEFNNAYVTFGVNDYGNNLLYRFTNSVLDINNGLTTLGSTRSVSFSNLAVSNSSLNFGVIFDGNNVYGDQLYASQSAGTLNLGFLAIKNDSDAGGPELVHRIKVLDGIEFTDNGVHKDITTSAYTYDVYVDTDDAHYVVLAASGPADAYSLDRQNMKTGERYYIWSLDNFTYHEGDSLHDMSSGTFYVYGFNNDASNSVLSGVLTGVNVSTDRGTFFNIEAGTEVDFYLENLTVTNAMANGFATSTGSLGIAFTRTNDADGSVLRMISDEATVNISNVIFNDNGAVGNGGAIYVGAGTLNVSNSLFSNNSAGIAGGAMYITNGTVNLNTDAGDILFASNTANGVNNDIYLDSGANLNFTGTGNTIITGGILSNAAATGINVYKTDSGTLHLSGINEVYGKFEVNEGTLKFDGSTSYTGGELSLVSDAYLDLHNGFANRIDLETFNTGGNLIIDIFADNTNDKIYVDNAEITGGSIAIMVDSGTYYNNRYYLIVATDSVTGKFSTSTLSEPLRYRLFYDDKNVWLDVNYMYVSTFSKLSPLTFNQSETARAIDTISLNPSVEWGALIDHFMWDLNEAEQLNMLSRLSGYFYANVVRNAAADIPSKQIYDKLRNHAEKDITSSGLWVQVRGGQETFYGDENSLGHYVDSSLGAMLGFDRYIDESGMMWGIYGGVSQDNIEQELNKADGKRIMLGFYGGRFEEGWELKGLLLGSYDMFDTTREVLGRFADGNIDAITVAADLEGALKYKLSDNTTFRPFIGLEAENVNYKGFDETGAGEYNLNVNDGNYLRASARLGTGIEYERKVWSAYANAEARYVITGDKPEVESVFENTNVEFLSRGTAEGQIQGGVTAGAEVKITNWFKVFANANVTAADRYAFYGGNAGFRFVFGRRDSTFGKSLAWAQKLAKSAEKESIAAQRFTEYGNTREAHRQARMAFADANESLNMTKKLKNYLVLTGYENMSDSERTAVDEKIRQIESTAWQAKDRIINLLFGVSELKQGEIFVEHAEMHLQAASELKKANAASDKIVSQAQLASAMADKALEKTDEALAKTAKAREKMIMAEGILPEDEMNAIARDIAIVEERALEIKNQAGHIIESEQNAIKKANERRSNPGAMSIRLHTANFGVDEAVIGPEDAKMIEKAARDILRHGYKRITVEGHTDNTGARERNDALSLGRAKAIRDKLIEYGIDQDKIDHMGFADTMPVDTNKTEKGKAKNRRAEIFVE